MLQPPLLESRAVVSNRQIEILFFSKYQKRFHHVATGEVLHYCSVVRRLVDAGRSRQLGMNRKTHTL